MASSQSQGMPFVWVPLSQRSSVTCLDSRHTYSKKEAIKKTARDIFDVISYFEDTQSKPFNDTEIPIKDKFFKCTKEMINMPLIIKLSFQHAMQALSINSQQCKQMSSLYDNLIILVNRQRNKRATNLISALLSNPQEDFAPIRSALTQLKDNIIINHEALMHQDSVLMSLFKNQLQGSRDLREISGSLSVDNLLNQVQRASQEAAENLKFTLMSFDNIFRNLQKTALRISESVERGGDCFLHKKFTYCLKAIPKVSLDLQGVFKVQYLVERVALQQRRYYTCLPTKQGLSVKHSRYEVGKSNSALLLDNGIVISQSEVDRNASNDQYFIKNYEDKIISVHNCFFNWVKDKIELCCKNKCTIQYSKAGDETELLSLEPFSVLALKESNFPAYINGQVVSLDSLRQEIDLFKMKELYASTQKNNFYSGLFLPTALEKTRLRQKKKKQYDSVWQIAQEFPNANKYFWGMSGFSIVVFLAVMCGCCYRYKDSLMLCCKRIKNCVGQPGNQGHQSLAKSDPVNPPQYKFITRSTGQNSRQKLEPWDRDRSRSPTRLRDNWTNVQDRRAVRALQKTRRRSGSRQRTPAAV